MVSSHKVAATETTIIIVEDTIVIAVAWVDNTMAVEEASTDATLLRVSHSRVMAVVEITMAAAEVVAISKGKAVVTANLTSVKEEDIAITKVAEVTTEMAVDINKTAVAVAVVTISAKAATVVDITKIITGRTTTLTETMLATRGQDLSHLTSLARTRVTRSLSSGHTPGHTATCANATSSQMDSNRLVAAVQVGTTVEMATTKAIDAMTKQTTSRAEEATWAAPPTTVAVATKATTSSSHRVAHRPRAVTAVLATIIRGAAGTTGWQSRHPSRRGADSVVGAVTE